VSSFAEAGWVFNLTYFMGFFDSFPDRNTLLRSQEKESLVSSLKVNNHIHSPYSFSAFDSIGSAVKAAREEGIRILGINDFYVTDGYAEFIDVCRDYGLFPLLNIELIGISKVDQEKGIRVNDPGNPGRTYISGKGLPHPSILPEAQQKKLNRVVEESNKQVGQMIDLVNKWMEFLRVGLTLSVEEIMEEHAEHLLRERHVAKAIRVKIDERAGSDEEFYHTLARIYGGKASDKQRGDVAGLEEELRTRLLKAGAPAFVPEDEKAFMSVEEIVRIIEDAGGIPTYPMLLDGAGGQITEFESDRELLLEELKKRGFRSVEMIPMRNRIEVLKAYAEYFYDHGFMVSFGTEHNTTAMRPLTVGCLHDEPLDQSLMNISFRGAACLAAHQYLVAREGSAYPRENREEMEQLGRAVLNHYFSNT
jgi:sugar phosphate isomerase/epimerase